MGFPLKDWIDQNVGCRHNLAESGMHGSVPALPARRVRFDRSLEPELRGRLADYAGVATDRVLLTHGATEANAWVAFYLGRRARRAVARFRSPEYPPLVDLLPLAGFRTAERTGRAELAVTSRPRNPEGDLWSEPRLFGWARGARHLLVDETFREFARVPSVARHGRRGVWATGTFTKFFGADHLRVGFAIAPPEEAEPFARFGGLVCDELPPASAAGALELLDRLGTVRREVRAVIDRNRAALAGAEPERPLPAGPTYFDRSSGVGTRLAEACRDRSVLVCPGVFFGDDRGVRVGMTRRSFPVDLAAYLSVRARFLRPPATERGRGAGVRPRRAGAGRATFDRS